MIGNFPALDQYQNGVIKGIKVDFMQRSDQILIDYYHRVSRETAKRKMLDRLSWLPEKRCHDRNVAQPDQHRRRCAAWNGANGARIPSRTQRNAALHANVFGADGLHAGRDAENATQTTFAAIHEQPWRQHALPSACNVCRIRESIANAGGQSSNYLREPRS